MRTKKSDTGDSDYSEDDSIESKQSAIYDFDCEEVSPKRAHSRGPKRGRAKGQASKRGSYSTRPRGRPRKKSYESENESENNSYLSSDNPEASIVMDSDSDDYCDSAVVKRKPKDRRKAKRKRKSAATVPAKKGRKKSKSSVDDESDHDTTFYPVLPAWPLIESRHIYTVAFHILQEVEQLDDRESFKDPVTEQFPDIADEYLGSIADPMDIRTINERLESYEKISELQDDLILMLKNCCIYNGEKDDLWFYSVKIWKQLNDIFKKVCKQENILLPRRF